MPYAARKFRVSKSVTLLAASQNAAPVIAACSVANFEMYSMMAYKHSKQEESRHTNTLPRLSSSLRMRSVACFASSTMVSTKEPKQIVPNDGPRALRKEPRTRPENSVVPTGAKYHWHIVPPMTYSRVSRQAEVTQIRETDASVV